ncbi:hypothetical protein KSX_68460 [Ktedonospora formicarum]|uniref:Uncharacterized protein n=1 Tax=Ktedonospora formicarum TaxID=2778364 RepID=A0A8J3I7R9_9CHLR|nr:hypothetical protein KSX_68460 [Ktedonospora formicarum]
MRIGKEARKYEDVKLKDQEQVIKNIVKEEKGCLGKAGTIGAIIVGILESLAALMPPITLVVIRARFDIIGRPTIGETAKTAFDQASKQIIPLRVATTEYLMSM